MNKHQIRVMLMDILHCVDYDIAKSFDAETAEEPEYVDERMDELIEIVQKHLDQQNKPTTSKNKKVK